MMNLYIHRYSILLSIFLSLFFINLSAQDCNYQPRFIPNFENQRISSNATQAFAIFSTDMDNDGDIDILSTIRQDLFHYKLMWYMNDGNSAFTEKIIADSIGLSNSISGGDLDQDGDQDLVVGAKDPALSWYQHDSMGAFLAHIIDTTLIPAQVVLASDIDGDGDIDILSALANQTQSQLAWYENHKNYRNATEFKKHLIYSTVIFPASIFIIDMDNDGDLDFLASSARYPKVAWYENIGNRDFAEHIISAVFHANIGSDVVAADIDKDEDLDIISSSQWGKGIVLYENIGDLRFTERIINEDIRFPNDLDVADVNRDGDLDIVSVTTNQEKIFWIENMNNEAFQRRSIPQNYLRSNEVHIRDLDQDGDLDFISGNSNFGGLTLHKNLLDRDLDLDGIYNCDDNCPHSPNPGLSFGRDKDYVFVNELTGMLPIHTFEAWIYLYEIPKKDTYVALLGANSEAGHSWIIDSTGTLHTGQKNYFRPRAELPVQEWVHIAATYDGFFLTLYVNGARKGTIQNEIDITNGKLFLGGVRLAEEGFFNGKIDEVRIWSPQRTLTQIKAYMHYEVRGDEEGLKAYYRFNEGEAKGDNRTQTTITDYSGNENHGEAKNFAKTGRLSNWDIGAPVKHTDINDNDIGDFCEGIVNIEAAESLNVFGITNLFPNPAKDKINIQFHALKPGIISFQLFDMIGSLLQEREIIAQFGDNHSKISLTKLPAGSYFVRLIDDQGAYDVQKIVVD